MQQFSHATIYNYIQLYTTITTTTEAEATTMAAVATTMAAIATTMAAEIQ